MWSAAGSLYEPGSTFERTSIQLFLLD